MTNKELIRELRKPGKVYVPVITASDVVHLAVEKADLITELEEGPPDAQAYWSFYGEIHGGRKLDINN